MRIARAELPVVHVGTTSFTALARNLSKSQGHADLPLVVVDHPFQTKTRDEVRAIAKTATEEIVSALLERTQAAAAKSAAAAPLERAELMEVPDDAIEFNKLFMERGWSEGLPLIAPTPERVAAMLRHTRRDPAEVVAPIAPRGAATVESIAINAVMAGCHPEYLPVLIAAVEAMGDRQFKLGFVQNTVHPTTTWLVVNGPIAQRLKINGGVNCLGTGHWSNATLGRALRLIATNCGGGTGDLDPSVHGSPSKFLMCCSENEAGSPWEALHVERGFAKEASTVTVIAAKNINSFLTHTRDIDDLVQVFGNTMWAPTGSEYRSGGAPTLVVSPEHAQLIANAGVTKAEFKRRVWEASKMPMSRMSKKEQERTQEERRADLGEIGPDTLMVVSPKPQDIIVIVAGGPGMVSAYVTCHAPISHAVTCAIDDWVPAS